MCYNGENEERCAFMDNFRKYMPYIISCATSFCKHICVMIIYAIIKYLFGILTKSYTFTPSEVFFWCSAILSATYISTSFAFSLFNKQACFLFLSKDTKDLLPELLSFDFLQDLFGTAVFFLIFSFEIFSIPAIIAAYVSNLVNFILARFIWLKDKENKVSTRLYELRLISHLLLSVIGLSLLFFFALNLIPAIPTLIMVAKMLSYLIFLPIGLTLFLIFRAIHKMRIFLKHFKTFCKKNEIEYPDIKKPYLAIFKPDPDSVFLLNTRGKTYSCSLVSFTNIFLPAVFKSDGFLYRISSANLKNKTKPAVSLERRYSHTSEYPKIIVITSCPFMVKTQLGNKLKDFDTGDMSGDCKIFTESGFFGAIERNTIERKSFE